MRVLSFGQYKYFRGYGWGSKVTEEDIIRVEMYDGVARIIVLVLLLHKNCSNGVFSFHFYRRLYFEDQLSVRAKWITKWKLRH
jgi:hypothetical protein